MKELNFEKKGTRPGGLEHWQIIAIYLVLYDIVAVNLSYFFALWIRFDMRYSTIPMGFRKAFVYFIPIYTVIALFIFWRFKLYQSVWQFASFDELSRIILASALCFVIHTAGITLLFRRMPISYYVFGPIVQMVMITSIRFAYRFYKMLRRRQDSEIVGGKNIMVVGAGSAGQMIVRELRNSSEINGTPRCIIDDNPNKWNRYIEGVPVAGGRESILESAKKYEIDQIIFAIPTASTATRREIFNIAKETECELRSLPGLFQLANGDVALSKLKPVAVEDLLGRDTIKVDLHEIFNKLTGKRILVTGGGGSIGSELCRQIASHSPARLIIFDVYENNAYEIEQELKRTHPGLNLTVLIGSVRDSRKVMEVFRDYKPEIVYHAAAHKHVPLMETSPDEAIKNNVIGTYKVAYAAMLNKTERFVLISTDKAVNPTSVMGASKRLCEMVIQTMDEIVREGDISKLPMLSMHRVFDGDDNGDTINIPDDFEPVTQYVAVRFGNVLGSNGSVIPLFKKQIEAGGPVTVTHPNVIRYFMTIPEAVSLVLQASVYALKGEIFVLDMGDPMKIDTLARNLIRLSGYHPDTDIKIIYTGLRPGEKLYEEKLLDEEGLEKTANDLIHVAKPLSFDKEKFLNDLKVLASMSYRDDPDIIKQVQVMVDTFNPVGANGQTV